METEALVADETVEIYTRSHEEDIVFAFTIKIYFFLWYYVA
jgi:hypothetical protein